MMMIKCLISGKNGRPGVSQQQQEPPALAAMSELVADIVHDVKCSNTKNLRSSQRLARCLGARLTNWLSKPFLRPITMTQWYTLTDLTLSGCNYSNSALLR